MEEIIKYVEAYQRSVDLRTCGLKVYNQVRLASALLRKLKAKQPFSASENPQKTADPVK